MNTGNEIFDSVLAPNG